MSKISEGFKEVLSDEQLSEEVEKDLLAKLISRTVETFNQILIEEQLNPEVRKRLSAKLRLALKPSLIEKPKPGPGGPDEPNMMCDPDGGPEQ
jgi:hypothetical protein